MSTSRRGDQRWHRKENRKSVFQEVRLGLACKSGGAPPCGPWGASHDGLMEEGGRGTSKGLAPSQADGLVVRPGTLLTSVRWHVSFT